MTSSIQANSLATLPLLKEDSLVKHCKKINSCKGERTKKYEAVFEQFKQAIRSVDNIKDIEKIRHNFSLVINIMPVKIHNKPDIQNTKKCLINKIQSKINKIYLKSYNIIKDGLKRSYTVSELKRSENKLNNFEKNLPEELKLIYIESIKQCRKIYRDKIDIACFDSQHQVSSSEKAPSRLSQHSSRDQVTNIRIKTTKEIYPILSIDGGGIRGIIPATMLVEIEKITREPIAKLFHLIGGTSTGGILTLGLSKPHENGSGLPQYRAQDLLEIYTQEHTQIFQKNPEYVSYPKNLPLFEKLIWKLDHPKYISPLPLFDVKLSDTHLSSALTEVLVTTNSFNEVATKFSSVAISGMSFLGAAISGAFGNRSPSYLSHDIVPKTVHYFTKTGLKTVSYRLESLQNSYSHLKKSSSFDNALFRSKPYKIESKTTQDFPMSFAAQFTSAAPTFFPPATLDTNMLLDGGILQNNPAIPCALESLNKGYLRENLFMISLGTGEPKSNSSCLHSDPNSLFLSIWMDITQADSKAQEILQDTFTTGGYHRFQYHFDQVVPGLDDNKPKTITLLQDAAKELVENEEDALRSICKVLKPGCL